MDEESVWEEDVECVALDIHTAASLGFMDVVQKSVSECADGGVDKQNREGWSPLAYAAYNGHYQLVQYLLNTSGRSVEAVTRDNGRSALMLAASCGNADIVKLLVQRFFADVEKRDAREWTALMHATFTGHKNAVEVLLECGACVNVAEPTQHLTPLIMAASEGHEAMIRTLLSHPHTCLEHKTTNGYTARMVAEACEFSDIVALIDKQLACRNGSVTNPHAGGVRAKTTGRMEAPGYGRSKCEGEGPSILAGPAAVTHLMEEGVASTAAATASSCSLHPTTTQIEFDGNPTNRLTNLQEFLADLPGVSQYEKLLHDEDIDLQVLLTMTDSDLKEVGIKKFGPRRKLTTAIARWHSCAPRPSPCLPEQTYADKLEANMQELAIELHKCRARINRLMLDVDREKELRKLTETCLTDGRTGGWTDVGRTDGLNKTMIQSADSALQLCERVQSAFDCCSKKDFVETLKKLKLCVTRIKRFCEGGECSGFSEEIAAATTAATQESTVIARTTTAATKAAAGTTSAVSLTTQTTSPSTKAAAAVTTSAVSLTTQTTSPSTKAAAGTTSKS